MIGELRINYRKYKGKIFSIVYIKTTKTAIKRPLFIAFLLLGGTSMNAYDYFKKDTNKTVKNIFIIPTNIIPAP